MMNTRPAKRVLVVDDETVVRNDLCDEFLAHERDESGIFIFRVDAVDSITAAIDLIRSTADDDAFDVLVLDLSFDKLGLDRSGLRFSAALGLLRRLGQRIPVEIIFSAYADLQNCVQAMRSGAWDVIPKKFRDGKSPYELVVESAVLRLRALDLQQRVTAEAVNWLNRHSAEVEQKYAGQVVAIWHEPEVRIVASGKDAFDLEFQLDSWRRDHADWMYPFVVRISEATSAVNLQGAWR